MTGRGGGLGFTIAALTFGLAGETSTEHSTGFGCRGLGCWGSGYKDQADWGKTLLPKPNGALMSYRTLNVVNESKCRVGGFIFLSSYSGFKGV